MENTLTKEEYFTIASLTKEALPVLASVGLEQKHHSVFMDFEFVHKQSPLRLEEMLDNAKSDNNSDFRHDVFGIYTNWNRQTMEMENCFVPRFTVSQ